MATVKNRNLCVVVWMQFYIPVSCLIRVLGEHRKVKSICDKCLNAYTENCDTEQILA